MKKARIVLNIVLAASATITAMVLVASTVLACIDLSDRG